MSEIKYRKCDNEFIYKNVIFNGYSTPDRLDETCRFEFLPNDIVISTFPRSGTTFTQEIVWQIKNRKTVQKGEKVAETMERFPFIEFNYEFFPQMKRSYYDILNSQKSNPYRLIKTHVPFSFIQENFDKVNPKMIVVMRNAKDCSVALYHHYLMPAHAWKGTYDEFFPIFLHEKTFSGSYFENNLEWWSLRERDNVLVLFYEDLVLDLPTNVLKIAKFMGDDLTEEELDKVVHNSSFDTMSKNPNINFTIGNDYKFVRKGIIGDWKNYLSEEQNRLLEEKIKEKFEGSGLEFIYE